MLAECSECMHCARTGHESNVSMALGIALRPDLIILDFQMPILNGIETARVLRANLSASPAGSLKLMHSQPKNMRPGSVSGPGIFLRNAEVFVRYISFEQYILAALFRPGCRQVSYGT
jgi:hypothetical protein